MGVGAGLLRRGSEPGCVRMNTILSRHTSAWARHVLFFNLLAQEELTAQGGQGITSNVCRSFISY